MYSQANMTKTETLWPIIMFVAVIFTAAEAPYSFVFDTRIQRWQVWADIFFSLLFFVDLVNTLRNQKKKKKKHKARASREDGKAKYYLLLSIDVLSCIPFDLIFYFFGVGTAAQAFKLLRMCRLIRIVKIYEFLNTLALIPRSIKFAGGALITFIVIHWFTLVWIFLHPAGARNHTTYYIKCFYWTVTTLTTVGYGDITPTTSIARIYTMFVMLLGVGIYGIVIGNISRIFAESARYKEQAREKFSELSLFMKHYHIPNKLQSSVFNYYNHIQAKRLSDNDHQIISELPQALKKELQIYMNMQLIRNLDLFSSSTQSCLKTVAGALEERFYGPGNTVIKIGEIGEEMFIIGHGTVDVISSDDKLITQLHEGQFFGEAALLVETTRNANIVANSYCDLYRLSKSEFISIIQKHPSLKTVIEKSQKKRSKK